MTVINKLEKLIEEDRNDWVEWYKDVLSDSADKLETKEDKLDYLDEIEFNGDYENLAYSQGYIQGLQTAIRELQK
jgi:hypothetical protein